MAVLADRLEALVRVSEALRTYHERHALFRSLARELRPVVRFDLLGLALLDQDTGRVEPFVLDATGALAPAPTLTTDTQLTHWVIAHQSPLVLADLGREPRFAEETAYLRERGIQSACCLPLTTPRRRVGMLLAGHASPHTYAEDDVAFLSLVANQVAFAVDDAQTYGALEASLALERERRQALETSEALLRTLSPALDIRDVFQQVSAIARSVIAHDMLSLPLISEDQSTITIYAVTGNTATFPATVPVPPHYAALLSGPWTHVIQPDLQLDPLERTLPPGEAGYRGRLIVPIRVQGRLEGALDFFSFQADCYTERDAEAARRIADHVALALSHHRLAEQVRRNAELEARETRLEQRVAALSDELNAVTGYRSVVGRSPAWTRALKQATQVAPTDTTTLLLGESGTGKEVIARFIHRASARSRGPFVALNCAALPEPLLESELFGFERGAFTGAVQARPGQLEQAAGGVLFLDEVGEMSPAVQAKFLRVLQEREFQRLGGRRMLKADVRVIAATNRNLRAAVARGGFREDLYYRLNVFEIQLPPLRERPDDVLPLSEAFLQEIARSFGRPPAGIARDARDRLLAYRWPGNVRELRNVLERAAILCDGGLITSEHLTLPADDPVAMPAGPDAAGAPPERRESTDLRAMERAAIERALTEAKFNKTLAARRLGLTRKQLYVRLRQHGLE